MAASATQAIHLLTSPSSQPAQLVKKSQKNFAKVPENRPRCRHEIHFIATKRGKRKDETKEEGEEKEEVFIPLNGERK